MRISSSMNKAVIAILSIILLLGLFTVVFYAVVNYSLKSINEQMENMHRRQTIAENVHVTSEWIQIKPEKALEPMKLGQTVELLIKDYEHDIHKDDFGNIQLKDGTFIKPEVEIIDENGKVYQLEDVSRHGNLIGFRPNEEIHGTFSFPKNVTYKAIRIRSDKPFLCKQIIWYDYDLK